MITFSRVVSFLGRNGTFQAKGINIGTLKPQIVYFEPITSKGKVARCCIEIPVEDIPKVMERLEYIMEIIE